MNDKYISDFQEKYGSLRNKLLGSTNNSGLSKGSIVSILNPSVLPLKITESNRKPLISELEKLFGLEAVFAVRPGTLSTEKISVRDNYIGLIFVSGKVTEIGDSYVTLNGENNSAVNLMNFSTDLIYDAFAEKNVLATLSSSKYAEKFNVFTFKRPIYYSFPCEFLSLEVQSDAKISSSANLEYPVIEKNLEVKLDLPSTILDPIIERNPIHAFKYLDKTDNPVRGLPLMLTDISEVPVNITHYVSETMMKPGYFKQKI